MRHAQVLLTTAILSWGGMTPLPAAATVGVEVAFDSSQCEMALQWAERALAAGRTARARQTRAEALYCLSMRQRDPVVLARAISSLSELSRTDPPDVFVALYLAEAESRRFPLWGRARERYQRVQELVERVDVGDARPRILRRVLRRLRAIDRDRGRLLPLLHRHARLLAERRIDREQLRQLILWLPQTGPEGYGMARCIVDRELASPTDSFSAFHDHAILLRDYGPVPIAARHPRPDRRRRQTRRVSSLEDCTPPSGAFAFHTGPLLGPRRTP
jgi:hypothetical protein